MIQQQETTTAQREEEQITIETTRRFDEVKEDYETRFFKSHIVETLDNLSHQCLLCVAQHDEYEMNPSRLEFELMRQLSGMPVIKLSPYQEKPQQRQEEEHQLLIDYESWNQMNSEEDDEDDISDDVVEQVRFHEGTYGLIESDTDSDFEAVDFIMNDNGEDADLASDDALLNEDDM